MLFATALVGTAMAQAPADSGLGLGKMLPPFDPTHVTGTDAGTRACPV